MKQHINMTIEQEIINELREKWLDSRKRHGIHVSHMIYCLTRSYYELYDPAAALPATTEEVMLFSLGFGLEQVLLKSSSVALPGVQDGVSYSPDFIATSKGWAELKTTRMSINKPLPDTWIEQMLSYCFVSGQTSYDLVVLHMMGAYKPPFPILKGWTIEFDQEEIDSNWARILERKFILQMALQNGIPPQPMAYCKDWECGYCRYKVRCNVNG